MMPTREPYIFAATVSVSTIRTYTLPIRRDGVLTKLQMRIYFGPELALRLNPYIQDEKGERTSVLNFATGTGAKAYIDGNDDEWVYDLRLPVKRGQSLVMVANNTNASNEYDFAAHFTVDYATWAQSYS